MPDHREGFHVVLSYGDIVRQSGYRTRILGELLEYERNGRLHPCLIVFDREAQRVRELDLGGVPFRAHHRSAPLAYYREVSRLSRQGPIRIVHAHNLYSGALALSARPIYGYKVLLDLHGRIPEEYIALRNGGDVSHWCMNRLERWVVRRADHILPVSYKLKDYLTGQYRLPSSKLTVLPDCADPSAFHWDPALRDSIRRRGGLEGKLVCVHLGSFFVWYDPALILKVFARIRSRIPTAHLLIVTEDSSRARDALSRELPDDVFTVIAAQHRDVPALLTASDVGLLLLRSAPNIEVSSPTKFSEYLNSGLPVLITPKVGDFSAMTANAKIGAIVSEDGEFDVAFLDGVLKSREEVAVRSMVAGRKLTWPAYRNEWMDLIERLTA
jgi:glycosyltransferase involved in cell wall biosynthesis